MDIFHDPKTKQLYTRYPGQAEYVPITEDQATAIEMGAPANAVISMMRTALSPVETVRKWAPYPGHIPGNDPPEMQAFNETGQALSGAHPLASIGGSMVGMAPAIAAATATGGSSLMGQVASQGVAGALLAPDNPALGFVEGGALGGAAMGVAPLLRGAKGLTTRVMTGVQATINEVRGGSLSAAAASSGEAAGYMSTERVLGGMSNASRLDELAAVHSMPSVLTKGDAMYLEATVGSPMERAAAKLRGQEDLATGSMMQDYAYGGVTAKREAQRALATSEIMRQLGETSATRLTSSNMLRLKNEIGGEFDALAAEVPNAKFGEADAGRMQTALDNTVGVEQPYVQGWIDKINDAIDENGLMPGSDARHLRTQLRQIITAVTSGGRTNFERAASLGDLMDVIDDATMRAAPPGVAERLADVRYKYRILKSLERSSSTTSAGGEINIKSFNNAYDKQGNLHGRASKKTEAGAQFYADMEALGALMEKVTPDSGTARRMNFQRGAIKAGGYGALGIAGLQGNNWLLGD